MTKKILVCGGAGFIGAHMCEQLAQRGLHVVVFDNLSGGHRELARWGDLIVGDLRNPDTLEAAFAAHHFNAVMHFAGKIVVSESTRDPSAYFENNVGGALNLLH